MKKLPRTYYPEYSPSRYQLLDLTNHANKYPHALFSVNFHSGKRLSSIMTSPIASKVSSAVAQFLTFLMCLSFIKTEKNKVIKDKRIFTQSYIEKLLNKLRK